MLKPEFEKPTEGKQTKAWRSRFCIHKSIRHPNFEAESVFSNDPWRFVELWLKRSELESNRKTDALAFWLQAKRFSEAASSMSTEAAPLPLYYAFLNATKALLEVHSETYTNLHGVGGAGGVTVTARTDLKNKKEQAQSAENSLEKEKTRVQSAGKSLESAKSQIQSAEASLEKEKTRLQFAEDSLKSIGSQVQSAEASLKSAEAQAQSAMDVHHDKHRQRQIAGNALKKEKVSPQSLEVSLGSENTRAQSSKDSPEDAEKQYQSARKKWKSAKTSKDKKKQQLESAKASRKEAEMEMQSAKISKGKAEKKLKSAKASKGKAEKELQSAEISLEIARRRAQSTEGSLRSAELQSQPARPYRENGNLEDEKVLFHPEGVLPALCSYLGDIASSEIYSLKELLWNLPFVRQAFLHTYPESEELFIPLERACYVVLDNAIGGRFVAQVSPRYSAEGSFNDIPSSFKCSENGVETYIYRTEYFKWRQDGVTGKEKEEARVKLCNYHTETRRDIVMISGDPEPCYLKRCIKGNNLQGIRGLVIIFAAMHRISSLSRYDPSGLNRYLGGYENWLLTEFIEHATDQFIDQIASEITGFQFMKPGMPG